MSRYDKYDPYDGGFRGPLDADIAAGDGFKVYAVGVNAAGRVVLGAGNAGIVGVIVAHGAKSAGDIVDVMTDGEIVEFTATDGTAATAGTAYTGDVATGAVSSTAADATHVRLGHTVEAGRLIVRVSR